MATRTVMLSDLEPGCPVPLDALGRMYRGGERELSETLRSLPELQRARLAVFCNSRSHMRALGLRIAAACDERVLIQVAGAAGSILFTQSRGALGRENPEPFPSAPVARRVSLARLAWMD